MSMHRLPGRIAAVMVATVAILVLTVGVSVTWMTRAMDDQSLRHSAERVRTALGNVLERTRSTTLDYAKWTEAAEAARALDIAWIESNIGTTTYVGDVAQLAVLWGGLLDADVGWSDAGADAAPGLLPRRILDIAEAGLAGVPLGAYRGLAFFAWHEGEAYALGAARVEDPEADAPTDDAGVARLILGQRLDREFIRGIGESVLLDGFEIVGAKPASRPSLPLMGGDARPVAHLTWNTQMAGTALLHRMLPPLAAVTALAVALVLAGMWLARRSARNLVAAERRSATAALTDGLTGLPNREAFNAALARTAGAEARAVLFLDLNGFKRINDGIGHAAGDLVIIATARRLRALCAAGCLLARVGGDEFVFVLTGPDAQLHVERLAGAVGRAMAAPFEVLGHALRLGAAVGYAVQAGGRGSGADLVRQADLAMYEAKRHPDGGPVAFGALIDRADRDARALEAALRIALERPGELSVAYQPVVDVITGRLVRAEALARWTAPGLGPVAVDRFIAVAERSGLVVELGRRLIDLVCDDLEAWPDLNVSIGVRPLQLTAPGFAADLAATLGGRGVAPARLEVSLAEGVVDDDPALAARRLDELHAAGLSTALTGFGTGCSSIGHLRGMGFAAVRIDRSLVSGIEAAGDRTALAGALILLCRALGLRVACEGVDTAEGLAALRALGCDLAQGHHLGRPQPIGRLMERWGAAEPRPEVA